ncbi:MAG TPA: c-type cytochrome [Ferruginibacter sp.]|nr:c-type cytochrome [Ferruginibacter sp.]
MHNEQEEGKITQGLVSIINKLLLIIVVLVITIVAIPFILFYTGQPGEPEKQTQQAAVSETVKTNAGNYWTAPEISNITDAGQKAQIEYGKELIAHTAKYLGPNGSVIKMSNGLNCQNCHLQAGTAVFGNNYGSVASLYPKFRARSGGVEDIYKRVNDCFERSLNGKTLNTKSKEMQAIVSYINFVGSNVEKGKKAEGSGLKELAWLERAADPEKGLAVYTTKCQSCHQANGEGIFNADKTEYIYPALWGKNSFNDGAGLYRISNFAKYVKYNMPQGVTHLSAQLTDEEAWDVAAFVTSQARPHINVPRDWPDISKKPVDHPFGPYADAFTEVQHKYGPFKPIVEAQKKMEEAVKQKVSSEKK